ncbi:hypothetical protein GCM10009675_40700 [Prauserella alba]|uniref:Uncharacterized protein n=1 Tax=Prauserella alba TaxID=176898 RepID=A0ABP4G8Y3_9PSEU
MVVLWDMTNSLGRLLGFGGHAPAGACVPAGAHPALWATRVWTLDTGVDVKNAVNNERVSRVDIYATVGFVVGAGRHRRNL